jgi:protein SCO1/2
MVRYVTWMLIIHTAVSAGCARSAAREYELQGQVLAIDRARQEITIKHGDIPQFMPGMTMAFKVRDGNLLTGRVVGDLVKATLVVGESALQPDESASERDSRVYLRTLERIGFTPVDEPPPLPAASVLSPGQPVSDAALVDESGAPRQLAGFRGHVVAVTFTYTRCPLPDFCPLIDRHFKAVQEHVRVDPVLKDRVRLLSVTLDPEYDTPAVLLKHAAGLSADPAVWRFATGARSEVERFGSQFGVSTMREAAGAPGLEHNLRTAVIDGEGRLTTVLNGGDWTPSDLIAALRKAAD